MSVPRIVSLCEYQRFSAKKMFSVPSVTMNGGSLSRVTSSPLSRPQAVPTTNPSSRASRPGSPWSAAELGHHDRRQHHDRADREVDAGGEDDERLGDAQRADHHDLLQDQRDVARRQEAVRREREDDDGERRGRTAARTSRSRAGCRGCGCRRWPRGRGRRPRRCRRRRPRRRQRAYGRDWTRGQPQQFSRPNAESLDSTPSAGLSVISVTPVSTKSLPAVGGAWCRPSRRRRPPRRPSPPSSAGTAARSRR